MRDYIDFCALSDRLGNDFVTAMAPVNNLYPQPEGEATLRQLAKQLAEPSPYDLDRIGLAHPWNDWEYVAKFGRVLSARITMDLILR